MADIKAIMEQIQNIINADKVRTFEEEVSDRETLKKLCWDVLVAHNADVALGRKTDEEAFRQADMYLIVLEHGAAIKDMPLFGGLQDIASKNPGTEFQKNFEAVLADTKEADLKSRNEALIRLLSDSGLPDEDFERAGTLINVALNRQVADNELPAESNRIEKEKLEADVKNTNMAKWQILLEWVTNTDTIPEEAKQDMQRVLKASMESGSMPESRDDRNLLDKIVNGSGSNDRYAYPGYYKWAKENNGKDLPTSDYRPRYMDHGRHFLLGTPTVSSIYKNPAGDIFIEAADNVIPREIMNSSDVGEIADFMTVHSKELDKISPLYTEYLQKQTEAIVRIESLAADLKNRPQKPPHAEVKRLGKGSELQIKQRALQTSRNGCWSVAYSNLLQSRGVEVSQQDIRAYRQVKDPTEAGRLKENERVILIQDETANPFEKRDILHSLLPDTAMQEVTFSWDGPDPKKTQRKAFENYMRKYIKDSIEIHHSPVALLVAGHYRTIVGYDGDRIIYQDSLPHSKNGNDAPEKTYRNLTFSELAKTAMDPETPVTFDSLVEVKDLPRIDAKADDRERSNPGSTTFMDVPTGVLGISLKVSYSKERQPQAVAEALNENQVQNEDQVQNENQIQNEDQVQNENQVQNEDQIQNENQVQNEAPEASEAPAEPEIPENTRLENAMNDVEAVYAGNDELTKDFEAVNRAAGELRAFTAPYYEGSTVLTDEDIDKILSKYDKLLRACDRYIRDEGDSLKTGFGQGRAFCIKALRDIVIEDMRALNEAMGITLQARTLLGLIRRGRSIEARIEKPEEIKTVGGAMSSRMPIRLKSEDGSVEEGFFTQSSELTEFSSKMSEEREKIVEKYGWESMEYRMAKTICNGDIKAMLKLITRRYDQVVMFKDPKTAEEAAKKPVILRDALYPWFNRMDEDVKAALMSDKTDSKTIELRKNFIDMVVSSTVYTVVYNTNHYYAGIPAGENIDKRNTAMSVIANYLGMGKLIAGARSFELKIGDETRKGTFQQKATGTDIDRVTEDSEILEIGRAYQPDNYEAVDTPELKRQLSDLMVLDYICGNNDRHRKNMVYKTKNVDGVVKVTGIQGIDNDMSFGTVIDAARGEDKMTNPADMRIMRLTTAHRVLDLTPDKLNLMLKDLNFTENELESCHARLENLQNRLRKDMDRQRNSGKVSLKAGRILVVPDEYFKYFPISRLGEKNENASSTNYFENMLGLPLSLKAKAAGKKLLKTDRKVNYADAVAIRGSFSFTKPDVRTDIDIDATCSRLNAAKEHFRRLGSKWFTADSGHYQWMKKSVEQLSDRLTELKNAAKGAEVVEIPKAEAIKLEAFFRQIRMSSDNYVRIHKDAWTPGGKDRLKLAREMTDMRVVNGKKAVKEVSAIPAGKSGIKQVAIGDLMEKEGTVKKASHTEKQDPVKKKTLKTDKKSGMSM